MEESLESLLFELIENRRLDCVVTIINSFPEMIHVLHGHGWTPLHWAARSGHPEIIKFLLEKGSNVKSKTAAGYSIINVANMFHHFHLAQIFEDFRTDQICQALENHREFRGLHNFDDEISKLVERKIRDKNLSKLLSLIGENAKVSDKSKWETVWSILQSNNLLGFDERLFQQTNLGRTILHMSIISECDIALIKKILQICTILHVNQKDLIGRTPLHYAAGVKQHNEIIIEALLSKGAIINATDNQGMTPLHIAAENVNCNIRLIECLMKHGANPQIKDECGKTPIGVADKTHIEPLFTFVLKKLEYPQIVKKWRKEYPERQIVRRRNIQELKERVVNQKIDKALPFAKRRHEYTVTSIDISPDSTLTATGSEDLSIKLWETSSGKELLTIEAHQERVESLVFSPCGKYLLSGSIDKTVRLWDLESGDELWIFEGHEMPVECVQFSPDSKTILSGCWDGTAKLWSIDSGEEKFTLQGHTDCIWTVDFSPNGKECLTAGHDCRINIWNIQNGQLAYSFDLTPKKIISAKFSANGKYILIVCEDGFIEILESGSGKIVRSHKGHDDRIHFGSFVYDSKFILTCGEDSFIKIWNSLSGSHLHTFMEHGSTVRAACFSQDGHFMVSGDENGQVIFSLMPDLVWLNDMINYEKFGAASEEIEIADDRIHSLKMKWVQDFEKTRTNRLKVVENLPNSKEIVIADGKHEYAVTSVSISPDSRFVLSGSEDMSVRIWDSETGNLLLILEGHKERVKSVDFSPCGNYVLSGSVDGTARVWDLASASELFRLEGHTLAVESAVFSHDGTKILTGSWDCSAKLWDATSGAEILEFTGHRDNVWSVEFSPDGLHCFTGSHDGTIKKWNIDNGNLIDSFDLSQKINSISVSRNGKYLLAATEESPLLLESYNGRVMGRYKGHKGIVREGEFFPNHNCFISCGQDMVVNIWNANTKQIIESFSHSHEILSATVSGDGRILALGDSVGNVVFYYLCQSTIENICDTNNNEIKISHDAKYYFMPEFEREYEKDILDATNTIIGEQDYW